MCNGLWAYVYSSMFRKHLDLTVCLSLSGLSVALSQSLSFSGLSLSVSLRPLSLSLSLSQGLSLSVVIMFVHCSRCVFLCILLGCLTHKLWLSNCVSMKRSDWFASHLLTSLKYEAVWLVCFTSSHLLAPLTEWRDLGHSTAAAIISGHDILFQNTYFILVETDIRFFSGQ